MLLQFTVSNFRAFREVQTLNLAASNYDKTLPQNCIDRDLPGLKNSRWLKGIALYGPNASGKTTVIDALKAFARMVTRSASATDPKDAIEEIQPFALVSDSHAEPTAFGVVLISDGIRYEYRVAATRERVWHESLRAFPNAKEQLWFSRDWQAERQAYAWTPEKPVGYRRDSKMVEFTLPNVLFLSKAISLGDTQVEPVFRWFKDGLVFKDLSSRTPAIDTQFTAQQFEKATPLAPRILELLRHADLGVANVRVSEERYKSVWTELVRELTIKTPPRESAEAYDNMPPDVVDNWNFVMPLRVELAHSSRGQAPVPLPWETESAGTHRLFALAGPWLEILQEGHTVCIDELDTSMHPLMVMALLRLLFSAETNPKDAQVIFTTHNPLLLDSTLIRRDQVWFADKDDHGEAHLYPMTDFAPRKGESLVRGYLAGRYGAVPFIPQGLLGSFPAPASEGKGGSDEL
ncbi:MAG: AAA family ATPase [Verrucomicrobia bacterium]|nr:AAA family ATPase [Verrucomicrobiota bacterium]